MKKNLLFLALVLCSFLNSYGQTQDRNNFVKKYSTSENPENYKVEYVAKQNFEADTIGNGLRQEIAKQNTLRAEQFRKTIDSARATYRVQDLRVKTVKGKKVKTIISNNELKERNAFLEKYIDSTAKAAIISANLLESTAAKDSLDTLSKINGELALNILNSIESIRLYKARLDSTKIISSRSELTDSVVYLITHLTVLNSQREYTSASLRSYSEELNDIISELAVGNVAHTSRLKALSGLFKDKKGELLKIKKNLVAYDSTWNHFTTKYIKSKPSKPVEVSALPFLSTIPGLRDYNGSINVIGSSVPNLKTGNYIEFGLFTGVLKAADSSNPYNVFISEVSNYAFYFKSNIGFQQQSDTAKFIRLAVNTGIFYANKPINKDTTIGIRNNFNSSFFQGKFGIEYIVYRNLFSAYFNGNVIGVVTNKDLFDKRFLMDNDVITYADFGFKMLLSTSIKIPEGLKLYFDLNFLINSGELKKINPASNDLLIPNFRIGLRADLGKI